MICCHQPLKIVKTFNLGVRGKTKDARCESCGKHFTVVEFMVTEVKKRGDGARAWARQLGEGKLSMQEEKHDRQSATGAGDGPG